MKLDAKTLKKEMAPFRRFVKLSSKNDPELSILKGHLLLEEKLRELIDTKLSSPEALEDARLTTHQVICLAEAFFRPQAVAWLWDVLHRLNKLRNDIAHKVQPPDLAVRMRRISEKVKAEFYPKTGFGTDHPLMEFSMSLWVVFWLLQALAGGQNLRDYLSQAVEVNKSFPELNKSFSERMSPLLSPSK
jgi:hypothetical protein